jgi:hypothetical protein
MSGTIGDQLVSWMVRELTKPQMADGRCNLCTGRPGIVMRDAYSPVPDSLNGDPEPCQGCGWRPFLVIVEPPTDVVPEVLSEISAGNPMNERQPHE